MPAEDYQIGQFIGRGSFGDVFKALHVRTQQTVAIKMVDLDETSDMRDLIKEIHILSHIRLQYLTQHFETFLQNSYMCIVLEYCGGGSCADLIKCCGALGETAAAPILKDVVHGLSYLHQQNKVHRDIKSANILLTDSGEVKLADFGVSVEITLTRTRRNTIAGTPYWMAPEVIVRSEKGYNVKADIWSLGITTIELVTGRVPHSQLEPMKALFEIPKKNPPELKGKVFSKGIRDFTRACLSKHPKNRPHARALLEYEYLQATSSRLSVVRELLAAKKQKERPRKKRPRRNANNDSLDLQWDFTTTVSKSPATKYAELVNNALISVLSRARTRKASEATETMRRHFAAVELTNSGFCHAFIEELFVLLENR